MITGFGFLDRIIGGSDVSPSHDLSERIVAAAGGDASKASEFVGKVAVVDEYRERPRAFSTPEALDERSKLLAEPVCLVTQLEFDRCALFLARFRQVGDTAVSGRIMERLFVELSEDRSLFPAPVYEIRRRQRIMESFLGKLRHRTKFARAMSVVNLNTTKS